MSAFVGRTPVIRIVLRNHFAGSAYPRQGSLAAVVDSGYDGFLGVPEDVYGALGLEGASAYARKVVTADGRSLELRSSLATADLGERGTYDGLFETGPGIEEVLAGTALLARFKLTLNYCSGVFRVESCH